jgi:hypothetical protein
VSRGQLGNFYDEFVEGIDGELEVSDLLLVDGGERLF